MPSKTRRASLALAVVLTTLAVAAPASADEYCQNAAQPIASVLVIHGGGWKGGSAAMGRDVCSPLARMGYRVRSLEYPLGTVPGAMAYADEAAKEEARRGRPVYAMGVSAGGSMAEYLAVKSRIDGAVAVAPLSDFVDWRPPTPGFWGSLGMTPELRRHFSPYHNIEVPAPLRIVHSPQDEVVPYEQSVRMVRRCGQACELITLQLGLGHASVGSRGPVLQWFARQAAHPGFASSRDARGPVISDARLWPRTFTVGPVPARGNGGARRRGTTFSYGLSGAANVAFVIERELRGKARKRCLRRLKGSRFAARCTVPRRVGAFSVTGKAGANRTRFAGTIRGKALRPGRYRATLVATSSSGRRSQPRSLRFRAVKRANTASVPRAAF